MSRDSCEGDKRKKNNLLTQYYCVDEEKDENKLDIDGKHFSADRYLDKLIRESSLKQLIDKERELVRETQSLDSEMQTLVYENYNKFILATDTIRQMKSDFQTMEDEMEKLVRDMSNIATFAESISSNLQDRRQQITKLYDIHELLKNLQFLFDLPKKLKNCVEEKNYTLAVKYYMKSKKVLEEFGDHPSFSGIRSDCQNIVGALKQDLMKQFNESEVTSAELKESAGLLVTLGEPNANLAAQFLTNCCVKLEKDTHQLSQQQSSVENNGDVVLQFIDSCCNCVLNNVALTVATYNNVFAPDNNIQEVTELATKILNKLCPIVEDKVIELIGQDPDENCCLAVVAALDKFNRRSLAVQRLLTCDERWSSAVIASVAGTVAERKAWSLQSAWAEQLRRWKDCWSDNDKPQDSVKQLEAVFVEQFQRAFVSLQCFVGSHVTFAQNWQFRQTFGRVHVRQGVLMLPLKKLSEMLTELGRMTGKDSLSPTLILILSRVAIDFGQHLAHSLLALVEEQFDIPPGFSDSNSTDVGVIVQHFKAASQILLRSYVQSESYTLVQMIRKSMDSRDWLTTAEPRAVRPVIKRILEEITRVDSHAAQLYEEGSRKERSSDSSRRTHYSCRMQPKSSWSSLGPSQLDSSLFNNIQKLFSERIDLSSAVEHNKVSVDMAIIKICLKGFLECVRLKTLSKFGFQQIQVDCYYLQLFLWRFTSDENLVYGLLDEILSSAVQRCLEPILMEASVVELICER